MIISEEYYQQGIWRNNLRHIGKLEALRATREAFCLSYDTSRLPWIDQPALIQLLTATQSQFGSCRTVVGIWALASVGWSYRLCEMFSLKIDGEIPTTAQHFI